MTSFHGAQHLLTASLGIEFTPESVQTTAFTTEPFWNLSNVTTAPPTKTPSPMGVQVVICALAALLMLTNGATLVAVVRMRSVRPKIKLLSGSLSAAHTLAGLTLMLPRVFDFDSLDARSPACILRYAVLFLSTYTTCCSILAMAVDRTVALTFPAVYPTLVTFKRTALAMMSLWVCSALLTAATLAVGFPRGHHCGLWLGSKSKEKMIAWHGVRLYGSLLLTCVVLVTALYLYVGVRLREQDRHFRASRQRASSTTHPVPLHRLERNTTVTVFSLAISFIIGYLPISVWALEVGWQEKLSEKPGTAWILVLPLFSCLLDPVIYFWRLQSPVAMCRKCWRRCFAGSVVPDTSNAGGLRVPADQHRRAAAANGLQLLSLGGGSTRSQAYRSADPNCLTSATGRTLSLSHQEGSTRSQAYRSADPHCLTSATGRTLSLSHQEGSTSQPRGSSSADLHNPTAATRRTLSLKTGSTSQAHTGVSAAPHRSTPATNEMLSVKPCSTSQPHSRSGDASYCVFNVAPVSNGTGDQGVSATNGTASLSLVTASTSL